MSAAATPQWKPQVEAGKLRLLLGLDETRNPRHLKYDMVPAYMGTTEYVQYAADKFAREKLLVETMGKE